MLPNQNLSSLIEYLDQVCGRGRTMLLPALHYAQSLYGWLPRDAQDEISRALRVPAAEIHGVIEFYSMFYNKPTPRQLIRFCEDPACSLAGAHALAAEAGNRLEQEVREARTGIEMVPCLGMCEMAPAALIGERPGGHLDPENLQAFLDGRHPEPEPQVYADPGWVLSRVGRISPHSLDEYLAAGGYRTLETALQQTPDALLGEVEQTGILGRGGAMFPLGRKWRFTRSADAPGAHKHVVVNADESEPGTFKDRVLIEEDPFSLIEAATLAAYAIGAENGWIFIRGEYPRGFRRLQNAVRSAREAGKLGKNIFGKPGFHFDIEVRLGAGAYICGEETALFEAIEGKRGFPRIKPPFPVTHGLFSEPTVINNVETLAALLTALRIGVKQWRAAGTPDSPGTKLFCLSGHVARPGLYEYPFGRTIRELIETAGGVPGGKSIQAVLMGGAAGKLIGPESLDMPLTYEDSRAMNIPLGSGVIQVFDETADMRQFLFEVGRFFAHESCGKCFPCQLGTQRQVEILSALANTGASSRSDMLALSDIGFAMTQTSLCGLGQTAASAVLSAMERWPEWFSEQHA